MHAIICELNISFFVIWTTVVEKSAKPKCQTGNDETEIKFLSEHKNMKHEKQETENH